MLYDLLSSKSDKLSNSKYFGTYLVEEEVEGYLRSTIVLYMSFSFWLFGVKSRDFSQATTKNHFE